MQSAMPMRDIMLKVKPAMYMTKKVEMSEVGMATSTATVERQPRKKKYSTRLVVIRPSIKASKVLVSEFSTKRDESVTMTKR